MKQEKIYLETTKKGHPAIWERGGGYTNTGFCQIACRSDGSQKKAVYVRSRGSLACENHALVIVEPGDLVIHADHHRGDFEITVFRIDEIRKETLGKTEIREALTAYCTPIHRFDHGEWDVEPPESLNEAIQAAKEKASCYHCREPHYTVWETA